MRNYRVRYADRLINNSQILSTNKQFLIPHCSFLTVLGSTGSIGTQTLDVAAHLGLRVVSLAAGWNSLLMEEQARRFCPRTVAMDDASAARDLKTRLADTPVRVLSGPEAICELAADLSADTVVTALPGLDGLKPTLAALNGGRRVALAGKEALVCAGELVMRMAREQGSVILPVDSEHSAIFQCLQNSGQWSVVSGQLPHDNVGVYHQSRREAHTSTVNCQLSTVNSPPPRTDDVSRLILTASGGPFFGWTRDQLRTVTPAQALRHPNWHMGSKITLDSATLVNKGLECIEAVHLFGIPIDRIDVVVHRQSVIHSMVVFRDGSTLAQLGPPDMRLPIQYALTWPERLPSLTRPPDWARMGDLTFAPPDEETFPAIALARRAAGRGGTAPAIFNGAAEEASKQFLQGRIGFLDIAERVALALDTLPSGPLRTLDDVFAADALARELLRNS